MIETEVSSVVAVSHSARRSLLWLVGALRGTHQELASDLWLVNLPVQADSDAESRGLLLAAANVAGVPGLPLDHPWLQRLAELSGNSGALQASPRCQPQHWNELEAQLLAPYSVAGGEKSIVACTLEPRPLLRLTFAQAAESGPVELEDIVCDQHGQRVSQELVDGLQLDELEIQQQPPVRRLTYDGLREWIQASIEGSEMASRDRQLIAATVIWCKFAAGRIALRVNGSQAEVHFEGWAQLYATGMLVPPPFTCSLTNISSYQVATTDAGVLTAAEAIVVCEHTQSRVLCSELATCADTGARVQRQFLELCGVTNQRVLPRALAECECCRQPVRRSVLDESTGICAACRSLQPVRKSDPRLARLLGEYPRLDRWRHWQLAETQTVYVLTAHTFFKRLLVVVRKSNLEPLRIATARRRRGPWNDVPAADHLPLLGEG